MKGADHMLAQAHTRTTATHEQQKAKLLPTYPEQIAATLTPRQVRATLAGQQYYLDHQNGKHLTHTQLSAWLRRKSKQWQRAHTSTEWQTYFMSGWYAALLSDPTAEKEHVAVPSILAGLEGSDAGWGALISAGGEDDDENNRLPLGEPDGPIRGSRIAPIKAGKPIAPLAARVSFGRDDDEERRPSFDPEDYEDFSWSLKRFPLWGEQGGTFNPSLELLGLKRTATWLNFPLRGQHGGSSISLFKTFLFGAHGGDEPGWWILHSLLFGPKDDGGPGFRLLFGPEDGDETGWSILRMFVFGPKDGGEPGWWIVGPHDGDDDTWGRAVFGGEDDRERRRSLQQYIALCRTCRPLWSDEDDDDVKRSPHTHEGVCLLAQRPSFGGEGDGDGEGFSPRSSLAPEDPTCDALIRFAPDDETEERCPSFGEEGEDGGYRPLTRPSFMCIDDDDEDRSPRFGDGEDECGGWYRSCLPLYLASQLGGGATLLPLFPLNTRSRPILPTEPADGDGDERCPCFPLDTRPAGHGPSLPDDDDGNALYPRSLTRQEGTRWQ